MTFPHAPNRAQTLAVRKPAANRLRMAASCNLLPAAADAPIPSPLPLVLARVQPSSRKGLQAEGHPRSAAVKAVLLAKYPRLRPEIAVPPAPRARMGIVRPVRNPATPSPHPQPPLKARRGPSRPPDPIRPPPKAQEGHQEGEGDRRNAPTLHSPRLHQTTAPENGKRAPPHPNLHRRRCSRSKA